MMLTLGLALGAAFVLALIFSHRHAWHVGFKKGAEMGCEAMLDVQEEIAGSAEQLRASWRREHGREGRSN